MTRSIALLSVLLLASCQTMNSSKSVSIYGDWQIEYIDKRIPIANSLATITFSENGSFSGNASCNRYFGSFTLEGENIMIEQFIGSTKMMCGEDGLMVQESRLLNILPKIKTANIENGKLILSDSKGQMLLSALPAN